MAKKNKKRPTSQNEENYDNHLKGVLFKNTRKRKGKKDPNVTGNVVFGRKELIKIIKETEGDEIKFWINGWTGESSQGNWFTSLKLNLAEPKDDDDDDDDEEEFDDDTQFESKKRKKKKPSKKRDGDDDDDDDDDDIPF